MVVGRRLLVCLSLALPAAGVGAAEPVPFETLKQQVVATADARAAEWSGLADHVWEYAEVALHETRSSALLADYLESQGFKVERGVAGLPTAFIATYGEGRPILGVLGEYDALPGISQQATVERQPLVEGGAGHGCGHNLLGVGALGAAVAARELLAAGELHGTLRFYGTPAEESVGGKIYMARAGLFDDLDAAITWHPDYEIRADTEGSQAMIDFAVEFHGRAAHAAYDPWNGRSALDGVELFTHGLNMMREHVRPTVRMHYVIEDGGDVPNVVPAHARVWTWVRDSEMARVEELYARLQKVAEGAALATGTEAEVILRSGSYEMLLNLAGIRRLHANLEWLGPLVFGAEEESWARALQESSGVPQVGLKAEVQPLVEDPGEPEGGSTDVADVSWIVPTVHLTVTTAPADVPWHAWPVVASSRTAIGHDGMLYAAKALGTTLVDLFQDAKLRETMRHEFDERRQGRTWKPWVPEGPPPIPTAAAEKP